MFFSVEIYHGNFGSTRTHGQNWTLVFLALESCQHFDKSVNLLVAVWSEKRRNTDYIILEVSVAWQSVNQRTLSSVWNISPLEIVWKRNVHSFLAIRAWPRLKELLRRICDESGRFQNRINFAVYTQVSGRIQNKNAGLVVSPEIFKAEFKMETLNPENFVL